MGLQIYSTDPALDRLYASGDYAALDHSELECSWSYSNVAALWREFYTYASASDTLAIGYLIAIDSEPGDYDPRTVAFLAPAVRRTAGRAWYHDSPWASRMLYLARILDTAARTGHGLRWS